MAPSATALATQQLAEFLAVVSDVSDAPTATRVAAERAARALEAEVGVVLGADGVLSAVGFPLGRTPDAQLGRGGRGERRRAGRAGRRRRATRPSRRSPAACTVTCWWRAPATTGSRSTR